MINLKNKLIIFMTTALFMLAIIVMGQNRVDAASWGLRIYLLHQRKLAEHGTISKGQNKEA